MKLIIPLFALLMTNTAAFSQQYERYKSLADTTIHSNSLDYDKNISITVPSEYQSDSKNKSFPLIIIFDSQNQRSYNYILRTIDYLTSNEQMPASIIIGIESTMENRYKETQLTVSDENVFGTKTESFIFDELIPYAQSNLNATNFNLLIGHSRYGYFTSLMLTRHPNELNAVISLSPFMTQKNVNLTDSIANLYANYSLSKTLYYRYGIGNDYPEDFEALKSKLAAKQSVDNKANFKGFLFIEADHNATPGLTIGAALYEIFEYWGKQQNIYINNDNKDINLINSLNDSIANHYGAPINFSIGTLNGKGWYFFNESEYGKAIEVWRKMLQIYPTFSDGYVNIIEAQDLLFQDTKQTINQLKESLKTTQFYSEEELMELQEIIDILEKNR